MSKRGRPRKAGARTKSGRLIAPHDYGNDKVAAHRAEYLRHRDSADVKAGDDLFCAIGQAHAAGLLEGTRYDGRVLMEHGREWYRLRLAVIGGGVRTQNFERLGRTEPSRRSTPTDFRYEEWREVLGTLSRRERDVINLVCIDYGASCELPPFLRALTNEWRVLKGLQPLDHFGQPGGGRLPTRADRERLEELKSALLAMVAGARKRKVG